MAKRKLDVKKFIPQSKSDSVDLNRVDTFESQLYLKHSKKAGSKIQQNREEYAISYGTLK